MKSKLLIHASLLAALASGLSAAPTPDPMTWDSPPAPVPGPAGETRITMTATPATDVSDVE